MGGKNASQLVFIFFLTQAELDPLVSSLTSVFTSETRAQGIWYKCCKPRSSDWVWVFDPKGSPLQSVSWGYVPGVPLLGTGHSQKEI